MRSGAKKITLALSIYFFCYATVFSQDGLTNNGDYSKDTIISKLDSREQIFDEGDGRKFVYQKPRPFCFFTSLPGDAAGIVIATFKRDNIKSLLLIGSTTVTLMLADHAISNGLQQFSGQIHFHSEEEYKNIIDIKVKKTDISIFKAPQNLNTGIYQLGQGFPSLLISAGLFAYGKVHTDYRAISTASQLAEAFILMGVGTQILKRITGRQSPSNAADRGGDWHLLPSLKNYQNNTPNYDAFPSGHLATLMSTITILAENYPDNNYIKPVGYSIMGLVGLSMINNNVHWASDYPLAIGLGYVCAKQVVKRNRKIISPGSSKKNRTQIDYTCNLRNGKLMPGIVCRF